MRIVAEQLVIRAMAGNLEATKLLFQYVLGKPEKTVNPDTLDLQEIEQMQQRRAATWFSICRAIGCNRSR